MQASVNVIVVEGGVTKNPELKYTQDGMAYTRFSLANSAISCKKGGEKSEEVSYFDVNAWGKLAEICATYLKKGTRLIVSGKLRQSRWTDQEGKNRSQIKIIAQDVKFLPNPRKNYKS